MPRLATHLLNRLALRALAMLVCGVLGAQSLAAQFTIENLEIHIAPGSSGAMTYLIPLRSEVDEVQQVRIWAGDWNRDSVGGNQFFDFGSTPQTCGGRLSVFPANLQLGPRAIEYVRVTYDPPTTPEPGCWGIVLSETVRPPSEAQAERSASVSINTIVGVKVYVHAANALAEGEIVSADVEPIWVPIAPPSRDSTLERQVALRLVNTGSAHLVVKSQIEIRDQSSAVLQLVKGPDAYITPGAFRDIITRLPQLPPGRYAAVVLLDFGADEISAAQVEFEIP